MKDVLKDILERKRKEIYRDEKSILKEYDDFWALNGIYYGLDLGIFRKKLKAEQSCVKKY